ncbi:hypothetical protein A2U01_0095715, partial [Trifolium medium]|nr:hypothetical protein [Trifolium medium]
MASAGSSGGGGGPVYHKVWIDDVGKFEDKMKEAEQQGHEHIAYHIFERVNKPGYDEILDKII